MAEPSSRRGSLRIPRVRGGNSRNSSIRTSALYDDLRQPSIPHPLRATSSRFSLNEQFAATRQEYELWDDDSSSIFERVTNASEAGDTEGEKILVRSAEDVGVLYDANGMGPGSEDRDWDFYDILCLPRDGELSRDQIRRAYYRLFLLFYPESYPEHLRPIARQQFLHAQAAFETLIDPARKAQYDVGQFMSNEFSAATDATEYEAALQNSLRNEIQGGIQTSSDLGLRIDATRVARRGSLSSLRTRDSPLQLLDFALSHSVSVGVPAIRTGLQSQISRRFSKATDVNGLVEPTISVTTPTISISGSIYGVGEDLSRLPTALLFDRYQPLLPLAIPRPKLMQLVENKLSPLVTLTYRQEVINRSLSGPSEKLKWIKTCIEVESDILPEPSITSRFYHHVTTPISSEPSIIETSIRSSRHLTHSHPRVTFGIHQNFPIGSGFLRADSGDWLIQAGEASRYFTDFSKMNPNMFSAEFPLKTAPKLELGFQSTPIARISSTSGLSVIESGIQGLDEQTVPLSEGSWAVSASATSDFVAGFVRYSKDLSIPFITPESDALSPSARLEVELCSSTFQDQYLAFRNLWSVGRFAKFGLEIGLSAYTLHLSAYWSRLGQRISIPFLISPRALLSPSMFFWAGALPFASLAALQLVLQRQKQNRRRRRKADVSEATVRLMVARHRYEADNLTVLLAQPVEARQKRQMSLGGLVIMSAKFGIPDANGDLGGKDVADVTIAVAALIEDLGDGGRLVIPKGVRKSRIPGFWDPVPGSVKTLRVTYSWKGSEAVAEVQGREELTLPPLPRSA